MPNAAIISANTELVRFFELELLMCGFTCSVYKSLLSLSDNTEIIFFDKDTATQSDMSDYDVPIIYVSSDSSKEISDDIILSWPTDISDIHRVLISAADDFKKIPMPAAPNTFEAIYIIDRENRIVALGERHIRLSKTEFLVLCELCAFGGKAVSRQHIMKLLGADDGNISDVYICALRKKLELPIGKRIIFTQRGVGYHTNLKMIE